MNQVRPKKHLGQHFLVDPNLAGKIVSKLTGFGGYPTVIEVGPGMGILSDHLFRRADFQTYLVEIDSESVRHLEQRFENHRDRIISHDFLKLDLRGRFSTPIAIIGNLPYNISSQIFFKILDHRDLVTEVVCMVQKEVGDRLCSGPGSKQYGILSVLLQAYFDLEKITTVKPGAFKPPPRVNSLVIRLRRNSVKQLDCNERLFFRVVKQGFQNRRKTLRNALKSINLPQHLEGSQILSKRAEQLDVHEFAWLTNEIDYDTGSTAV